MLPHRSVSERAPLPAVICKPHRASDSRVPDGAGWCCSRLEMPGAYLYEVQIEGGSLMGANLSKADLSKANLSKVNLCHASM
jgi:uncharacterized protein YjbI with pentapeptide repeats